MVTSIMRRVASLGAKPVDAVLPSVIALIGVTEMIVQNSTPIVVAIGTLLVGCAATLLRRSHPILSALGVLAAFAAAPLLGFDVSKPASWILLLVLASFAVGRYLPRNALPVGLMVVVGLLLGAMVTLGFLTKFSPDLVFGLAAIIAPWVLGLAVRNAEDRAALMARETERARVEDAFAAERSTRAERDRIAREIHDVLAHSLSLMVVQAAVAENAVDADQAAAKRAARDVQAAGRSALSEIGRLVRLIREDPMLEEIGPFNHFQADLASEIRTLAQGVSRAGLPVTLELDSTIGLSPDLQLTAYRLCKKGSLTRSSMPSVPRLISRFCERRTSSNSALPIPRGGSRQKGMAMAMVWPGSKRESPYSQERFHTGPTTKAAFTFARGCLARRARDQRRVGR